MTLQAIDVCASLLCHSPQLLAWMCARACSQAKLSQRGGIPGAAGCPPGCSPQRRGWHDACAVARGMRLRGRWVQQGPGTTLPGGC